MRLLLVTRHFPPDTSGGVRRWLALGRELAARGVDLEVCAPDAEGAAAYDAGFPGRVHRVAHPARRRPRLRPDGTEVAPAPLPRNPSGLRDWVRANFLLPDPDIRWAHRVAAELPRRLDGAPDWIVTTSPPESVHFVGYRLSRRMGCAWHADFRDYWLEYPLMPIRETASRARTEARVAARWLARASLVTGVDAGMTAEVSELSGQSACELPHFLSPAPEPVGDPAPVAPGRPDAVRLLYTGAFSLSDPNRSLEPVVTAFEAAHAAEPALELHHAGRLTPAEAARLDASPAAAAIHAHGRVSLARAREMQSRAHALLLTAAPGAPCVPGKYYEYAETGRPVIAVGRGSWRDRLGLPADAVAAMTAVARGEAVPGPSAFIPTVGEVADRLLSLYAWAAEGRAVETA